MPAYELDRVVTRSAAAIGIDAAVISTPSYLECMVADEHGAQTRFLASLDDVSYDLEKLTRTVGLSRLVQPGDVGVDGANHRLDEIEALRSPFPAAIVGVAYAGCGAGFAVILSAAWIDVALAAVLSVVVFLVGLVSERSAWLSDRVYVTSAFVAAVFASATGVAVGESDSAVVALCSFVVLVPGLGLTLGALELAAGQTLLGWHRLIKAAVRTFALFAGAGAGALLVGSVVGVADAPDRGSSSALTQWLFLIVLMVGLVVVFQVPPRLSGWALAAGMLAYAGLELGKRVGDSEGPFLGALVLGLFAVVFVRLSGNASPLVVVLPGILILVPGVAAYASLRALDTRDATGIAGSGQGVLTQIVAILAGLFAAGSLIDLVRPASATGDHSSKESS